MKLTEEQQEAVTDYILEQMAELVAEAVQPMTPEDIGYAAAKEYYGIERDQIFKMDARLDDGVLHARLSYLLPSPIEYIKINLTQVN